MAIFLQLEMRCVFANPTKSRVRLCLFNKPIEFLFYFSFVFLFCLCIIISRSTGNLSDGKESRSVADPSERPVRGRVGRTPLCTVYTSRPFQSLNKSALKSKLLQTQPVGNSMTSLPWTFNLYFISSRACSDTQRKAIKQYLTKELFSELHKVTWAARVLPLMNIQIKTKTLKLQLLLNVNTTLGIHVVVCDNAFIKGNRPLRFNC